MTDFINGWKVRCRLLVGKFVFSDRRHLLYCVFAGSLLLMVGWKCFSLDEKPPEVKQTTLNNNAVADMSFTNGRKLSRKDVGNPFLADDAAPEIRGSSAVPSAKGPRLVLTGTATGANGSQALLKYGNKVLMISPGETQEGITLVSIADNGLSAVAEEKGKRIILELGR